MRPVFHFSERRIRAHFFVCVLAYLLENHLGQRLEAAQVEVSARAALETLETQRVVDYDLPVAVSSRILIFTWPTPAALAVLRKLGLRPPDQLTLPVAARPRNGAGVLDGHPNWMSCHASRIRIRPPTSPSRSAGPLKGPGWSAVGLPPRGCSGAGASRGLQNRPWGGAEPSQVGSIPIHPRHLGSPRVPIVAMRLSPAPCADHLAQPVGRLAVHARQQVPVCLQDEQLARVPQP